METTERSTKVVIVDFDDRLKSEDVSSSQKLGKAGKMVPSSLQTGAKAEEALIFIPVRVLLQTCNLNICEVTIFSVLSY